MMLSDRIFWPILGCGLALTACGPADLDDPSLASDRGEIVGGHMIGIEDAPWQVSLQEGGSHFCGGTILGPEWILTANHCFEYEPRPTVVAGVARLSLAATGQRSAVDRSIGYPGYVDASIGKDVALLHLATPLVLDGTTTRAVAFADDVAVAAHVTDPGVVAVITGWGALSESSQGLPDELYGVQIPIVSNEDARRSYGSQITDDQLAAGVPSGGRDSCQGDSGGPLVVADASGSDVLLAGVVSWGYGCAEPDMPGMYARVSSFAPWIHQQIDDGPTAP
jgi:secreted trypsin-like serine protease